MTEEEWAKYIAEKKPKIYYDFTPITAMDLMIIIAASASPLMAVLLNLCFWTGIEVKYLLEMTYGDLNTITNGTLSIYYTYGIISGVPLSTDLQQMLAPYIGGGKEYDFLFAHEDGSTWTPMYVNGTIEDLSKRTGITFTAESLQKSYYANTVFNLIPSTNFRKRKKALKEAMTA